MNANDGPPREAVKQTDGSWIQQLEDGSTMRWTRRPDGTWRKPEHKRAGWVGELEQQKYVSKGEQEEQRRQAQMQAQIGRIPGLAPGQEPAQTKSANERKKEKRKEKTEEKLEKRFENGSSEKATSRSEAKANESREDAAEKDGATGGRSAKALEKKLRQIEQLEERQAKGEALNEDQLSKIAAKAKIQADLTSVLNGEEPRAEEPKAVVEESVAVDEPVAPAAAQKNKKAIEKKLRQIADIELKQQNGEELNEDQRLKLASKAELEAQLKSAS
mmetsp:Transcript_67741/g.107316  ORF Transcript_67741/g.107316 Transcript_67741/m.107316 type:complete len:274 (+) Transcript_67741:55-876(+)|eukprot:CAMPEP_0169104494 /NCGR_PEP_ID=MMETSP1015-20121227/23285_1 /TAXON_ID=342587 /ORGANISM="Karlodinium micrum, Strain CCMP2283" /LENGTH=273 /DNA_ID=CAMNT_0009165775 /DNA_START=54 /DNA_END=875 /DNA_ORIENTATION=+